MDLLCGRRPGWHWVKVATLKNWQTGYLADEPPHMEVDAHNYAKAGIPVPPHRRVIVTPTEQARVESIGTVHGRWGAFIEPPDARELDQAKRVEPGWYWALLNVGTWVCGRVLTGTLFSTAFPFPGSPVADVVGWVRLCGPNVPDSVALGVEAPSVLETGAP